MKKVFHFSLTLFCIGILSSCQIDDPSSPSPGDTFLKYYGVDGTQVGSSMIYLEDRDEIIIYGVQNTNLEGANADLFLLRVNTDGNELNSNTVDFGFTSFDDDLNEDLITGAGDDIPGSLRYVSGIGLVYVGTSTRNEGTRTFNALVWAIINEESLAIDSSRAVPQGEILFADVDTSSLEITQAYDLIGNDVVVVGDTSLQIVGTTDRVLVENGDETNVLTAGSQFYLAQVSLTSGEIIRQRTTGFPGNDISVYIDQFADGDFVIVGMTENVLSEGTNAYLLPVTSTGSPLDGRRATISIDNNASFNETVNDVFKRPNGYIVTGTSRSGAEAHPFFINFGYSGNGNTSVDNADTVSVRAIVESQEVSGIQDLDATSRGIALGENGNYFIVGSIPRYEGKNGEILIVQADQFGQSVAGTVRNYGLASGNDLANEVIALPGGSLLVLTTVDFGGNSTLLGLMKVNLNGDLMD